MSADSRSRGDPAGRRTAVITGATSGIGAALATDLVTLGYRVVVVGRDPAKCEAVASRIRGSGSAEPLVADLSILRGVRVAASELSERCSRIDVLVNNAGAVYAKRAETPDGLERTFALNVLAPFLLTNLLHERLAASAPSRVVMVASEAHRRMRIELHDLQARAHYSAFGAYGRSKLALILLTQEFARRWAGGGVSVNAVHPGFVRTRFGWDNGRLWRVGMRLAMGAFGISAEAGARTPLYAANSPDLAAVSGAYVRRERVSEPSRASRDPESARRMWEECERLAGPRSTAG